MNDIGWAVEQLNSGKKVAREGWNGRGMYLGLRPRSNEMTLPYVYMRTVQGDLIPWLCSQSDLLADDWVLVE